MALFPANFEGGVSALREEIQTLKKRTDAIDSKKLDVYFWNWNVAGNTSVEVEIPITLTARCYLICISGDSTAYAYVGLLKNGIDRIYKPLHIHDGGMKPVSVNPDNRHLTIENTTIYPQTAYMSVLALSL